MPSRPACVAILFLLGLRLRWSAAPRRFAGPLGHAAARPPIDRRRRERRPSPLGTLGRGSAMTGPRATGRATIRSPRAKAA